MADVRDVRDAVLACRVVDFDDSAGWVIPLGLEQARHQFRPITPLVSLLPRDDDLGAYCIEGERRQRD